MDIYIENVKSGFVSFALMEIPPLRDMTSLFWSRVLDRRTSWGSNMLVGSLSRSVGYCRGTYDDATEASTSSLTDRRGNENQAQIRLCARRWVSAGSSASPDGDAGHKMRDFCSKQMAATSIPCGSAFHMTQYPACQSEHASSSLEGFI